MELILNDEFKMQCPDGFRVLSDTERGKMNFTEEGKGVVISNPDLHILITIGWKQINGFASKILNEKDVAKKMERHIRMSMVPFGFMLDSRKERLIGGMKARGFGYEYTARDCDMYAESYAAKKNKTIYYFHFYARSALKEESVAIWKNMLDLIRQKSE